jgi:cytochrome c1
MVPVAVWASGGKSCGKIECDDFEVNLHDQAALQRGAQVYMNYCMGCHSLRYARYERTANDLGIPLDMMHGTLIQGDAKIGDLMKNAMPDVQAKKWFGAAPPDLTLIARRRGPEWLYTYLRSFYVDPARPYGANNLVFPDVGMPHVLFELQGEQVCKPAWAVAANGGIARDPVTYENIEDEHHACGRTEHVAGTGQLSPEAYDRTVADLVSFLEYVGEPMQLERQRMGIFTLLFLALFLVVAWMLNREYWKDVH